MKGRTISLIAICARCNTPGRAYTQDGLPRHWQRLTGGDQCADCIRVQERTSIWTPWRSTTRQIGRG